MILEILILIANALKVSTDVFLKDSLTVEPGNHEGIMYQIARFIDHYAHEYHYMVAGIIPTKFRSEEQ